MSASPDQIDKWVADGTWSRLTDARDRKVPIKIKRSDGSFSTGLILEVNIRCIVAWGTAVREVTFDGSYYRLPQGVASKCPLASELIEWNSWLGPEAAL